MNKLGSAGHTGLRYAALGLKLAGCGKCGRFVKRRVKMLETFTSVACYLPCTLVGDLELKCCTAFCLTFKTYVVTKE